MVDLSLQEWVPLLVQRMEVLRGLTTISRVDSFRRRDGLTSTVVSQPPQLPHDRSTAYRTATASRGGCRDGSKPMSSYPGSHASPPRTRVPPEHPKTELMCLFGVTATKFPSPCLHARRRHCPTNLPYSTGRTLEWFLKRSILNPR